MLHNTAVTKHGCQNGLISRMLFSELYKIILKKVTFVGFMGCDRPNTPPPLGSASESRQIFDCRALPEIKLVPYPANITRWMFIVRRMISLCVMRFFSYIQLTNENNKSLIISAVAYLMKRLLGSSISLNSVRPLTPWSYFNNCYRLTWIILNSLLNVASGQ